MSSKTFSTRVREWEVLPTAALHGKILELQNQGEEILDLTIGISNRPIPQSGKDAAIEAIKTDKVPYTAISGSSKLKTAIQKKLKQENNITCELDNIIVTTGAKQAIFETLYTLTNPGDQVAMITPYWSAYTQIATMLNLSTVFYTLDEIPNLVDRIVDTNLKVLLFDLPHNPTGHVFTRLELQQVIDFAKKNDMYILADESYEKLVYDGEQISLATVDPSFSDHIITVLSVSQTFSMMGWRIGYAVADKEIISAMQAIQSAITAGTSSVSQTAAAAIISGEKTYIEQLREDFKQRRDATYQAFSQIPWGTCEKPESGPYFWCNIEKLTTDSLDFSVKLLEQKKIAIMPGDAFGGKGWIRIAFNILPTPILLDAVNKIAEFGKAYNKSTQKIAELV